MLTQVNDALIGSFQQVLIHLAHFLPAVLALLLAIALFTLLASGVAWMLRKILTRARFDERTQRDNAAGVVEWSPSHRPTLLVSRIAFWSLVLLGVTVGISAYDSASASQDIAPMFLPYLAHSVGAFIIAVVGTLVARYISRSVLISASNARLQYARMLSLGVKYLVYVFTGAMVLDHLGIGGTIVELGFGILFGGMVLTLALAIGLGSRDIVARSIERSADRSTPIDQPVRAAATETPRTLRHF